MPIYRNGKKITKIMRNGKEISKVYRGGKLVYQNKVNPGTVLWEGSSNGGDLTLNYPLSTVPNGFIVTLGSCYLSASASYSGVSVFGSASYGGGSMKVQVNPSWANNTMAISASAGGASSTNNSSNNSYLTGLYANGSTSTVKITKVSDTKINVSGLQLGLTVGASYYVQLNDLTSNNDDIQTSISASGSDWDYAQVKKIVAY